MHLKVPGRYDVEGAAPGRRPDRRDRPQRHARLEPHRLHRSPVRLAPAGPGPRRPHRLPRTTATTEDDHPVTVAGARRPRHGAGQPDLLRHPLRPGRRGAGHFDWTASPRTRSPTSTRPTTAPSTAGSRWAGPSRSVSCGYWTGDSSCPGSTSSPPTARGEALYADHSVVPRVTDALAAACIPAPFQPLYASSGQAVLDGSRSACELGRRPGRRRARHPRPGQPARAGPRDYVTNSNDSYWLANPAPAGGLRAHHRRRTDPAQPADPSRPAPGAAAPRRHRRAARPRVHHRQAVGRDVSATGCTAANWSATTWSARLHGAAHRDRLRRHDRRPARRLHDTGPLGSEGRPRTAAAHTCSPSSPWPAGCASRSPFAVSRPAHHASRLATDNPGVRTALADAVRGCWHPARRPPRRHPDRAARRPAHPDPRRARARPASST